MTHAHCRSCDATAARQEIATEVQVEGEAFDRCNLCGSLDVDILSDQGLKHEQLGALQLEEVA